MLRWVAAFCRPLRPVLLLVSFPRSRSAVVGVLGLCWMWQYPTGCPHDHTGCLPLVPHALIHASLVPSGPNGRSFSSPAERTVSTIVGLSAALASGASRYSAKSSLRVASCLYSPARLYGGTLWETMVPYLRPRGGLWHGEVDHDTKRDCGKVASPQNFPFRVTFAVVSATSGTAACGGSQPCRPYSSTSLNLIVIGRSPHFGWMCCI